jgi:hypothetical protein
LSRAGAFITRHGKPGNVRTFVRTFRVLMLPRALFLILFLAAAPVHAQLMDSIRLFVQEEPRIVAKLDIRGSFISNSRVSMWGAKVGLEHARRFQYGLGYSFLFTDVERIREVAGVGPVNTGLSMGYFTPYVDYAFYQRGPWEARIPVQMGIGRGSIHYRDAAGRRQVLQRSALLLYEPAMTIQYRFARHFGLSAGWGFRIAFRLNGDLDERITAPIYTAGVRVFLGEIWRDHQDAGE